MLGQDWPNILLFAPSFSGQIEKPEFVAWAREHIPPMLGMSQVPAADMHLALSVCVRIADRLPETWSPLHQLVVARALVGTFGDYGDLHGRALAALAKAERLDIAYTWQTECAHVADGYAPLAWGFVRENQQNANVPRLLSTVAMVQTCGFAEDAICSLRLAISKREVRLSALQDMIDDDTAARSDQFADCVLGGGVVASKFTMRDQVQGEIDALQEVIKELTA